MLAGTSGDLLEFQLMLMIGARVIAESTSATFERTLEELAAEDCSERLSSSVALDSDVRVDLRRNLSGVPVVTPARARSSR